MHTDCHRYHLYIVLSRIQSGSVNQEYGTLNYHSNSSIILCVFCFQMSLEKSHQFYAKASEVLMQANHLAIKEGLTVSA